MVQINFTGHNRLKNVFYIFITFVAFACSGDPDKEFISRAGNEDFDQYLGYYVHYRGPGPGNPVYMFGRADDNCGPLVVTVSANENIVLQVKSHLRTDCGPAIDTMICKDLVNEYLKLGIVSLSVGKDSVVEVNTDELEGYDLIRLPVSVSPGRFSDFVPIEGRWYRKENNHQGRRLQAKQKSHHKI
ncbi:MAG TPA: hypothetical protein VK508_15620 [Cyclobacteriaceae bacterium]|nr:hypothetical protein [Cyclobacteriaceae bacterium]